MSACQVNSETWLSTLLSLATQLTRTYSSSGTSGDLIRQWDAYSKYQMVDITLRRSDRCGVIDGDFLQISGRVYIRRRQIQSSELQSMTLTFDMSLGILFLSLPLWFVHGNCSPYAYLFIHVTSCLKAGRDGYEWWRDTGIPTHARSVAAGTSNL